MPSETKNIYQRVFAIMEEVQYIQKDLVVAFKQTRYKGLSHDAVTKKIRAALIKHRVLAIPNVEEH